jgi:hypothetical protein
MIKEASAGPSFGGTGVLEVGSERAQFVRSATTVHNLPFAPLVGGGPSSRETTGGESAALGGHHDRADGAAALEIAMHLSGLRE